MERGVHGEGRARLDHSGREVVDAVGRGAADGDGPKNVPHPHIMAAAGHREGPETLFSIFTSWTRPFSVTVSPAGIPPMIVTSWAPPLTVNELPEVGPNSIFTSWGLVTTTAPETARFV